MTTAADKSAVRPQPAFAEAVIKCVGLSKVFRDFWLRSRVRAVDGIDLEVRRGEVFGLLGPNGSGKSTTIKMILGLLHPSAGRIAVFGKRPDDVATKSNIGYLPEESYLYRFLNARETLDYYGRLFHQNRTQRNRRIDMLLEMVGLDAVQRRPVGEYSKGMQRRIGLAQALINDPQLLILDEPTTGMDPLGARQIKDLIIELSRRGKTILLCSHLLSDVEDVCDRVSIMFGGKVRAQGTVDELLVRQDQTLLHTDALDVETIQAIESLLEARGLHIDRVESPRQKLEALFLDIVHQAQAEGAITSGAKGGGKLAEFLVDRSGIATGDDASKIIDSLISTAPAATPSASAPTDGKINRDADAAPPTTAPPARATDTPAPPADQSVVDNLLVEDWKWAQRRGQAPQRPGTPSQNGNASPAPTTPPPSPATPPVPPVPPAPAASAPSPAAPTTRPAPAAPATPPPATTQPPAQPPAKTSDPEEKPDESFINALLNVPPYKEEDEKDDKNKQA